MFRRLLIACAVANWCVGAQASCDTGLAERMHAKLYPDRVLDREHAGCKIWPGFVGRYIVVLPLQRESASPGSTGFDLDVLVVQQADNGNTDRARVTSRLFETDALVEDAVRITDIHIDTSRYTLARGVRAFGLRVRHSGSSRNNPYANEELRLYVPDGGQLRKVLNGLETTRERGNSDINCSGTFEQLRTSITVSHEASSNGLADLVVSQTRMTSHAETNAEGQCLDRQQPATFKTTTLHYDGSRYPIPPALRLD